MDSGNYPPPPSYEAATKETPSAPAGNEPPYPTNQAPYPPASQPYPAQVPQQYGTQYPAQGPQQYGAQYPTQQYGTQYPTQQYGTQFSPPGQYSGVPMGQGVAQPGVPGQYNYPPAMVGPPINPNCRTNVILSPGELQTRRRKQLVIFGVFATMMVIIFIIVVSSISSH